VTASWSDGIATITVSDTGVGIAPDLRARIFDRFEQGDGSSTRRYGGTGLGLAIVKELAHLVDCEITVDSTPGEGSRFTLRLPLPECIDGWATPLPQLAAVVPDPVYDRAERGPVGGPLVLVADDNPVNAAIAGDTLEILGCRSVWAPDGPEAVETLGRRGDLDAVLLDLHLPGMHGSEVARQARRMRGPSLPIVVISADMPAVAAGALPEVDLYLAKPVRLVTLRDALRGLGVIQAPFDIGGIVRVRSALSNELTNEALSRLCHELDDLYAEAARFSEKLRTAPDSKQLHFRAHRNLVGGLLYAQQMLRSGQPTGSERDFVIECLNRAIRWEDTWAEPDT
jgi:CheY-like chemotaxis protein